MPSLYNIPAGVPFLPTLAKGLKATYGDRLSEALIFLPTRRAARQLGDLLVGEGGVSLLPRLRPLADIDPDEPPFEPGFLSGIITPDMPSAQRRFELSQLVTQYYKSSTGEDLSPAASLSLTDPLLAILDDAALEEVKLSDKSELDDIMKLLPQHFQNAGEFYKILQTFWPEHLKQQDLMEPMARRVALLDALTDLWLETPPNYPVVIAGSTGTLKATSRLIRCVAHLKDGLVLLPGLNRGLKQEIWEDIAHDHPQYSLKKMLERMDLQNDQVENWSYLPSQLSSARQKVMSESLVPVTATGDWSDRISILRNNHSEHGHLTDVFSDAIDGLSLIETRTDDEEALTIALILRETLESSGKTAALITPDPALARRVRSRLSRWDIEIEYTQGEPLEETRLGSFLTAILQLSLDMSSPLDLARVLTHPLCHLNREFGLAGSEWRTLENSMFRGLRPELATYESDPLIVDIYGAMAPLLSCQTQEALAVKDWAQALSKSVEALAATPDMSGSEHLWTGEAGQKASALIEELIAYGACFGPVGAFEFVELVSTLMRGRVVRPRVRNHPRLQILGPLEARMILADRIILGGLNEGVWPASPAHMPFLSRGMRQKLGLSLPERRYGLAAHDFAMLASYPDVYMTRSERSADSPQVASRWIWRLKTLLNGALGEEKALEELRPSLPYLEWAREIDFVQKPKPAKPPKPKPPLHARWPKGRELSVTRIKTWVRDPYSIYARTILGLVKLDDLDTPIGPREYGNAIHNGLEQFISAKPDLNAKQTAENLTKLLRDSLLEYGLEDHDLARETIRIQTITSQLMTIFQTRAEDGWSYVFSEEKGKLKLGEIDFTLTGKPDLVDVRDGAYAVLDYKTGQPPGLKEVKVGFDPQLPLLGLMLLENGFAKAKPAPSDQLFYIQVKGSGVGVTTRFITVPDNRSKDALSGAEHIDKARNLIIKLVQKFDDPDTAYPSQPRSQFTNSYGDYDHMARRGEWQKAGDESGVAV